MDILEENESGFEGAAEAVATQESGAGTRTLGCGAGARAFEDDDFYRVQDPEVNKAKHAHRNKVIRRTFLSVFIVAALAIGGYAAWDTLRTPDFAAYAQETIELVGLGDESIFVSVQELSELDCVLSSSSGTGAGSNGESKAGTVKFYGPLLETLLAEYGYSQTDFRRIVVTCKKEYTEEGKEYNYTVVLTDESLERDIYISIAYGKDALEDDHTPARMVIPGEETGRWAYGIMKIDFQK